MANALDILIRFIVQGQQGAQQAANETSQAVENTGQAANNAAQGLNNAADAGNNAAQGLNQAGDAANNAAQNVTQAATATTSLEDKLESLRNKGAAMTALGVGGLALANHMIEAGAETAALDKRLESLLAKQGRLNDLSAIKGAVSSTASEGHFSSDDETAIENMAVHLARYEVATRDIMTLMPQMAAAARTSGHDFEEVAEGVAEAFKNVDPGPIEEALAVFLDDATKKTIENTLATDENAARKMLLDEVTKALATSTVSLGDSITDGQAAANDLDRQLSTAMSNAGAGASEAKSHVDGLFASLVSVVNTAPSVQYAAGYLGYFGSYALTAVGGVLTLGSQVGMTAMGMQAMGISGVGAFSSMTAAAATFGATAYAAVAPLIPLVLVAAAAFLALAGAYYAYDQTFGEGAQLNANIAAGDDAERQRYELEKKGWEKKGQTVKSFEEWKGDPDSEFKKSHPAGGGGAPDLAATMKQLEAAQAGAATSPTMPAPAAMNVPATAATAAAPKAEAPAATSASAQADKDKKDDAKKAVADVAKADAAPTGGGGSASAEGEMRGLISFLEGGGSIQEYDAASKQLKDKKGAMGGGSAKDSEQGSEPTRVEVKMPTPSQKTLPSGKIEISFGPIAPVIIDNPLERQLKGVRK